MRCSWSLFGFVFTRMTRIGRRRSWTRRRHVCVGLGLLARDCRRFSTVSGLELSQHDDNDFDFYRLMLVQFSSMQRKKKTLFFSRIPFVSLLLRFLICCRRTTTVVSSIHPCSVVLKRVRVNLMSMRRRKLTEFAEHCSQKDMHT